MVNDRHMPQGEIDGDRGAIEANAERLLRLPLTLPGRRDDALAIVNGFFGDRLADQGSTLAIPMALRSRTDALALDRDSLAERIPQATGRICLLVHGLMANESVWEFPGDHDTTYGSLLAGDHGVTPVYLRYNTGRHISVNGRELAGLLHRLVTAWPVPVHDISLIGHSMGGLVIRSARHYASATRPWSDAIRFRWSWTSKNRRAVLIGVPNTGAPLEQFVNLTSAALWSLPVPFNAADWPGSGHAQRRDSGPPFRRDHRWGLVGTGSRCTSTSRAAPRRQTAANGLSDHRRWHDS